MILIWLTFSKVQSSEPLIIFKCKLIVTFHRLWNKIVLSANFKLNSIEVLISKALIDSNISHDEFVLINNVLKEYDDMKEEKKNLKT